MHQVVLNRKKLQIYVTIIIMATIAIWLTQNYPNPQSKSSLFLSWQLAAISCQVHHPVFQFEWLLSATLLPGGRWHAPTYFGHQYHLEGFVIMFYVYPVHPWLLFISDTYIQSKQNCCYAVMGLTRTFEVNFIDSNMIPWFLSLNDLII